MLRPGWLALLLGAFALRVQGMARESFWRDEVDAVLFAQAPWSELLAAFGRPQHNGPLYHAALRLWTDAVGTTEHAVRYFSTLGDMVALCLVVAAARRLGGRAVAVPAGLVWTVLPAAVWYAQEAKMYSWLAAVGAACLWLAAAAPTTLARRAGAVALAVGALYLHYFALLLALPSALLAASAPGTRRPAVPRSAVARVAATVAVAGLAVVAAATLSREWDTLFAPRPTGHPFVPLAELPLRILFGITLNTPPMPDRLAVALLVVPVLAGALPLRGESPRDALRRAGRLWLFIAAPLAAFYVVSLSLPLFAERYFVILMPPVVLLVARAMAAVWTRSRLAGLAAGGALLLVFGYVAASQQGSVDKADYRALGAHLRAHARSADALMVVMPYNERSVRFYAGPSLAAIAPPPAPPGVTAAELERASAPVLAGRRRVWLVLAEPEQWDPGGAIAGWLAARSSARTSFAWRSVRLELFELR